MRESFGGAFMIKLVLIFIVIYISFMAVAINYAKAFRIKNRIIDILEQNQYVGNKDTDTIYKIENFLKNSSYNYVDNDSINDHCKNEGGYDPTKMGICIVDKEESDPEGEQRKHFKVITYISISFPIFKIYMTVPISGETKTIVY